MPDLYENFAADALVKEADAFVTGNKPLNGDAVLELIERLLDLADDDESDYVLLPAVRLCELLCDRGSNVTRAQLAQAKCHFILGEYSKSYSLLDEAKKGYLDDDLRDDLEDFEERLIEKVTWDGKISIYFVGGLISLGILYWLRSRRAASPVSDSSSTGSNNE